MKMNKTIAGLLFLLAGTTLTTSAQVNNDIQVNSESFNIENEINLTPATTEEEEPNSTPPNAERSFREIANPSSWEYKLRNRLTPLITEAKRSKYSTGICVYDLTGDSILFQFNSQKLMRPASNQKLLTSITALDQLGKDGEYTTAVYVKGHISRDQVMKISERRVLDEHYVEEAGGMVTTEILLYDTAYVYKEVLHGSIYVKGTFDPLFTTEDLNDLALAIGKLPFEEIDGELIGDVSMKDSLVFGKGWCWDDMPSYYVPWLSPLLFNEGIRLKPKSDVYMKNPDTYFLDNLVANLREKGKDIRNDQLRLSFLPTDAETGKQIYKKTHTVEDVLNRMMKKSNNQFAESMFYLLGYNNGQLDHPTTADDCAERIKEVMRKAECKDVEETTIADGSGLSLYNYVTPENEVLMLRYAYQNKHIFDPLYKNLPIAGVDGTISTRMKSGAAYKNVHAKTGTVKGVSTLAGYMRASNGNMLAFAIMNNGVATSAQGRNFQDRVCQALAK